MFNIMCGIACICIGFTFDTWQSWACVFIGGLLIGWNKSVRADWSATDSDG